jgi:uncharacterized membrane protein
VDLPQEQGSDCAALKIAMVVVTVTYAAAVAVLQPSNTLLDSVILVSNAAVGTAGNVAVLFSPSLGPRFVLAQGIVAVVLVGSSFAALVFSGRMWRRLIALCNLSEEAAPTAAWQTPSLLPCTKQDQLHRLELLASCICECRRRNITRLAQRLYLTPQLPVCLS